jgi:hypothetical protein
MTIKAVPARDIAAHLLSKGFREEAGSRDHRYFYFWLGGKKQRLRVKLSLGASELAREEIKRNAFTFGISGNDLYRIVNCELDEAGTTTVWRASSMFIP